MSVPQRLPVGVTGEAFAVAIVEKGQQAIRQVIAEYFQEKENEIPALSQKLLNRQVSLDEAINYLCGLPVIRDATVRATEQVKQQFHLACLQEDEISPSLPAIRVAISEIAGLLKNHRAENILSLAGSLCYEAILEKFLPLGLINNYAAGSLWRYLCEPFASDYNDALEKKLTALLETVKVRLSHDLSHALAQNIYTVFDGFQEQQAGALAG
ncbi:MAG: hypothetical protein C4589_12100 [Peptococcaceae bacterium]|nr:MAG: hypothetical protein C4589_12100 [Peptococcaceae bacterium]